jgi:putative oxidoreductase
MHNHAGKYLMDRLDSFFSLGGRILIALIFVFSGLNKIGAIESTQGYMEAMGVPGVLIYPTILFEASAGLAIVIGYQTRIVALALAGFCLVTAVIFHNNIADQTQFVMFMKNLAMSGGFLFLARDGAGQPSLDSRRKSTVAGAH